MWAMTHGKLYGKGGNKQETEAMSQESKDSRGPLGFVEGVTRNGDGWAHGGVQRAVPFAVGPRLAQGPTAGGRT